MSSITPELARIWQRIQVCLLPGVEECLHDALTQRLKQLVAILEILRIEEHVTAPAQTTRGRPPQDRRPIARALVAKAIYNLPHTDLLIEMIKLQPNLRRLCGWERKRQIPSARPPSGGPSPSSPGWGWQTGCTPPWLRSTSGLRW